MNLYIENFIWFLSVSDGPDTIKWGCIVQTVNMTSDQWIETSYLYIYI